MFDRVLNMTLGSGVFIIDFELGFSHVVNRKSKSYDAII